MNNTSGLVQLHNDDWGYETNCFVCEPTNSAGLQIPFFHDRAGERVIADVLLSDDYSGAPTMVHGGVVLAVLDEAMAWACIAVGHRWAMTTETTTKFARPVLVERQYRVIATIVTQDATSIRAQGSVTFENKGETKTCAESEATFAILGEAQVTRLTGDNSPDTSYTR